MLSINVNVLFKSHDDSSSFAYLSHMCQCLLSELLSHIIVYYLIFEIGVVSLMHMLQVWFDLLTWIRLYDLNVAILL
jgi:hypothetical protein